MGVPVFFGWGKKGKVVGYIGIDKCPNCKNYVHFQLYEYANNVNLYFVPVAKWNKKIYLVCSQCEAAWELKDDLKEEMLDKALRTPDPKVIDLIWDRVDEIVAKDLDNLLKKHPDNTIEALIEKCVADISDEVSDVAAIREVAIKYMQYSLDNDKAR